MTEESKYPVLKIEMEQDIPLARWARVSLDGRDITKFLRNLRLELGVDYPMRAYLEIIVRPDIPKMLLDKIEVEECDMIYFERFKESLNSKQEKEKIHPSTASELHKKKMHVRPEPKTKPPTKR